MVEEPLIVEEVCTEGGDWSRTVCALEELIDTVPCISSRLLAAIAGVDQRVASRVLARRAERYGFRRVGSTVYCSCRGSWDAIPEPRNRSRITEADLARIAIAYTMVCRRGTVEDAAAVLTVLARKLGVHVANPRRSIIRVLSKLDWAGLDTGGRLAPVTT